MATINFGKSVTLEQAAQIIARTPSNRFLIEGEPGIGKSSLIKRVAQIASEITGQRYLTAYCDVPNMDLGDIAMPVVHHDSKTTRYYPNARFKLTEGQPVVIMLDEFTKGAEPIKNMLHPLLETKARLGDIEPPEGTVTFMTGNLTSDGVGDSLKAHSLNRITRIRISKPTSEEWLAWAVTNGIDPVVMAWVNQFPHCMASYLDGNQDENLYIYNPKRMQTSYVSPRSLERASHVVKIREHIDSDTFIAALSGTIGEAAARDMEAFVAYQDQLPTWENIINNPKTAPVPDSAGACAVLIFGAVTRVEKATMTSFMDYLKRFEEEWQAAFAINIMKSPKQSVAMSNRAWSDWVRDNSDLL
jgi:hypothetical protein